MLQLLEGFYYFIRKTIITCVSIKISKLFAVNIIARSFLTMYYVQVLIDLSSSYVLILHTIWPIALTKQMLHSISLFKAIRKLLL